MAYQLDVTKAAAEANQLCLQLPKSPDKNHFKTMNHTGAMFNYINSFDRRFINEACRKAENFRVLEIGCAYGHICLAALSNGCNHYTAVEPEENHLKVL